MPALHVLRTVLAGAIALSGTRVGTAQQAIDGSSVNKETMTHFVSLIQTGSSNETMVAKKVAPMSAMKQKALYDLVRYEQESVKLIAASQNSSGLYLRWAVHVSR